MEEIKKQLEVIADIIINIELADKRKANIEDYINSNIMNEIFGKIKLAEQLNIKDKSLKYWHRRLQREVVKLSEKVHEKPYAPGYLDNALSNMLGFDINNLPDLNINK